jgi:hypothetical protein
MSTSAVDQRSDCGGEPDASPEVLLEGAKIGIV